MEIYIQSELYGDAYDDIVGHYPKLKDLVCDDSYEDENWITDSLEKYERTRVLDANKYERILNAIRPCSILMDAEYFWEDSPAVYAIWTILDERTDL